MDHEKDPARFILGHPLPKTRTFRVHVDKFFLDNFSFLGELEVSAHTDGWFESDYKAISVQVNLTGTETELGKK